MHVFFLIDFEGSRVERSGERAVKEMFGFFRGTTGLSDVG